MGKSCCKVERRSYETVLFFFLYFENFEKRGNGRKITEMIFATSVIAVLMSSALAVRPTRRPGVRTTTTKPPLRCYVSLYWSDEPGIPRVEKKGYNAYCYKQVRNTTAINGMAWSRTQAWSGFQRKGKPELKDQSGKFTVALLKRSESQFVCKEEKEKEEKRRRRRKRKRRRRR